MKDDYDNEYDYNNDGISENDFPQDYYDNGWEVPPGDEYEREGD